MGVLFVYRMTFALFLYHVIMLLLILPRTACSAAIHDGGWLLKFVLIAAMFVGFQFIPNYFFWVWAQISLYVGIIFLIFQVLYVLSGAHYYNDLIRASLSDKDGALSSGGGCTMLFLTLLFTALSVTLVVTSFFWFNGPQVNL